MEDLGAAAHHEREWASCRVSDPAETIDMPVDAARYASAGAEFEGSISTSGRSRTKRIQRA